MRQAGETAHLDPLDPVDQRSPDRLIVAREYTAAGQRNSSDRTSPSATLFDALLLAVA